MASEWWDPNGKFKPLHMLNPCRLDYIIDQVSAEFTRNPREPLPFKGLRILDIGCGGGLLCEPMARLGATVIGADAAERNIPVARVHAEQMGLDIDYRHTSAEALDELFFLIETAGLTPVDRKGFVFNPLGWSWSISDRDLSVNYVTASTKPA